MGSALLRGRRELKAIRTSSVTPSLSLRSGDRRRQLWLEGDGTWNVNMHRLEPLNAVGTKASPSLVLPDPIPSFG